MRSVKPVICFGWTRGLSKQAAGGGLLSSLRKTGGAGRGAPASSPTKLVEQIFSFSRTSPQKRQLRTPATMETVVKPHTGSPIVEVKETKSMVASDLGNLVVDESTAAVRFTTSVNWEALSQRLARLPAFSARNALVDALLVASREKCRTLLVRGATGCGKSCVVPLALASFQEQYGQKEEKVRIFVTQPTRIACMNIASFVKSTLKSVGIHLSVGWAVSGLSCDAEKATILYCTPGYLLSLMTLGNPAFQLTPSTHIILDEAHCRDVDADLLMVWCRLHFLPTCSGNLIVMSATLAQQRLCEHFKIPSSLVIDVGSSPTNLFEGKTTSGAGFDVSSFFKDELTNFPLTKLTSGRRQTDEVINTEEDLKLLHSLATATVTNSLDFVESGYDAIARLTVKLVYPNEHVLIFVPGFAEMIRLAVSIKSAVAPVSSTPRCLETLAGDVYQTNKVSIIEDSDTDVGPFFSFTHNNGRQTDVILLHSTAIGEVTAQLEASSAPCRIIISTNVSESSVTFPSVKYVLDFATERFMIGGLCRVATLKTRWASQSSLLQRRGRAGRSCDGYAIHFCDKLTAQNCKCHELPEVSHSDGEAFVLKVKQLFSRDPFWDIVGNLLDPPSKELLLSSHSQLQSRQLVATNCGIEDSQLTNKGLFVASIPVEPKIALFILHCLHFGILADGIIVAAGLMVPSIFSFPVSPEHVRAVVSNKRLALHHRVCDQLYENPDLQTSAELSDIWAMRQLLKPWFVPQESYRGYSASHSLNYRTLRLVDMYVTLICRRLQKLLPKEQWRLEACELQVLCNVVATRNLQVVDPSTSLSRLVRRCHEGEYHRVLHPQGFNPFSMVSKYIFPPRDLSCERLLAAFVAAFADQMMVGSSLVAQRLTRVFRRNSSVLLNSLEARSKNCVVLNFRPPCNIDPSFLKKEILHRFLSEDDIVGVHVTSRFAVVEIDPKFSFFGAKSEMETRQREQKEVDSSASELQPLAASIDIMYEKRHDNDVSPLALPNDGAILLASVPRFLWPKIPQLKTTVEVEQNNDERRKAPTVIFREGEISWVDTLGMKHRKSISVNQAISLGYEDLLPKQLASEVLVEEESPDGVPANYSESAEIQTEIEDSPNEAVSVAITSTTLLEGIRWNSVSPLPFANLTADMTVAQKFCLACQCRVETENWEKHLWTPRHLRGLEQLVASQAPQAQVAAVMGEHQTKCTQQIDDRITTAVRLTSPPLSCVQLKKRNYNIATVYGFAARFSGIDKAGVRAADAWIVDVERPEFIPGILAACSTRYPVALLMDESHNSAYGLMIPGWMTIRFSRLLSKNAIRLLFAMHKQFSSLPLTSTRETVVSSNFQSFVTHAKQGRKENTLRPSLSVPLHWCHVSPIVDGCRYCGQLKEDDPLDRIELILLYCLQQGIISGTKQLPLIAFVARLCQTIAERSHGTTAEGWQELSHYLEQRGYRSVREAAELAGCVFTLSPIGEMMSLPPILPCRLPGSDWLPQLCRDL